VRQALERLPGVVEVGADHSKDSVWVKYREGKVAPQQIASAIRREVIFPRIRRALAELGHLFGRRGRPL
jgi:copper chaperone CopZ